MALLILSRKDFIEISKLSVPYRSAELAVMKELKEIRKERGNGDLFGNDLPGFSRDFILFNPFSGEQELWELDQMRKNEPEKYALYQSNYKKNAAFRIKYDNAFKGRDELNGSLINNLKFSVWEESDYFLQSISNVSDDIRVDEGCYIYKKSRFVSVERFKKRFGIEFEIDDDNWRDEIRLNDLIENDLKIEISDGKPKMTDKNSFYSLELFPIELLFSYYSEVLSEINEERRLREAKLSRRSAFNDTDFLGDALDGNSDAYWNID